MSITLSTSDVEIDLDVDQVEKLIKSYLPSAKIEIRDGKAYIVVPLDSISPIIYSNGKFKVKVPVPQIPLTGLIK